MAHTRRLTGVPASVVTGLMVAVLTLSTACGAHDNSSASAGSAAGGSNANGSSAGGGPEARRPSRADFVSTFCKQTTGLTRHVERLVEDSKRPEAELDQQAVRDVVAVVRRALASMGKRVSSTAPPTFDGGTELKARMDAAFAAADEGLAEIDATVSSYSPTDPDLQMNLGAQLLGVSMAAFAIPMSLVDIEALKRTTNPSLEEVARLSPGYLGLLRRARDLPECAFLIKGSKREVDQLLK